MGEPGEARAGVPRRDPPVVVTRLADLALLGAAGVATLVLVSALTRAHAGVTVDQLLTFYVAPLALAGGLASILTRAPEARLNAALLVTATGFGLVVAEAVLLLTLQGQGGIPLHRPGQERAGTLRDVVLQLRAEGDHSFPRVPGSVLATMQPQFAVGSRTLHPLAPSPGGATVVLCNETGTPVVYRADAHGFNNPAGSWEGRPDLVLIGDSYTHGVCVSSESQLGHRLRARLRTVNLGASGAGPLQELAILREYAAPLAPPVVAWIYYEGNDLVDLTVEARVGWLTAYLDGGHSQGLFESSDALASPYAAWLDSLVEENHHAGGGDPQRTELGALVRSAPRLRLLRRLAGFGVLFPSRGSRIGLMPEILERGRRDVAGWGGQLLLVYVPAYFRYQSVFGPGVAGKEELIDVARELGVPVLDMDAAFREWGDPRDLWAHPRGHLSETGYGITAAAITDAVRALHAAPIGPESGAP